MCNVHIGFQEMQAAALMPHVIFLFGNFAALHLGNSTAIMNLCNQGCRVSLFHSRQACCILDLDKRMV